MAKQQIVIRSRRGSRILDLDEALAVYEQLGKDLAETTQEPELVLTSPSISPDGYIGREAISRFLAQVYPNPKQLRVRTGRLFMGLLRFAEAGRIPSRCTNCGGNVNAPSCKEQDKDRQHHFPLSRKYIELKVSSILTLKSTDFLGRYKGHADRHDFELLKSHL